METRILNDEMFLFEFVQSYFNKPVDELKDPIGDSSGDEMYNSDTKTTYMRREL